MMELVTDSRPDPAEEGRDLTSDSGISESTGVLAEEEGLAEDGRTEPPEEVRLGEDTDTVTFHIYLCLKFLLIKLMKKHFSICS